MLRKIFVQTFICFIFVVMIMTASESKIEPIQRFAESFIENMSISNIKEDIKTTAADLSDGFKKFTGRTSEAIDVMTGKPIYGEPIDEVYDGDETPVYAVGGGKVIAVGENEEIGKYIKIKHGDQAESLYGNLSEVHVIASANVKKGQIIGIYLKNENKDFYYSFKEF